MVFLVTESEAITYHYELDLRLDNRPDPRIAHTLNLRTDTAMCWNPSPSPIPASGGIAKRILTLVLLPDTLDRIREGKAHPTWSIAKTASLRISIRPILTIIACRCLVKSGCMN